MIAGMLVTHCCRDCRWMALQGGRVRNASEVMGAVMTVISTDVMD